MIENVIMLNSMGNMTFDNHIVESVDVIRPDTFEKYAHNGILLLEGGCDINPAIYGETNRHSSFIESKDAREIVFYKKARSLNIPILGICRGHQLIAALNGGTLYQDIWIEHSLNHHGNMVNTYGIMTEWYPEYKIVNSLHHQGVKHVPENALVVACDYNDHLVEALWYPDDKMFSVQWHPELMGDEILLSHIVKLLRG